MDNICTICNRTVSLNDIRGGVCWECMEAESVIDDGTDMYDKVVATTPLTKLEYLINQGWHYGIQNTN